MFFFFSKSGGWKKTLLSESLKDYPSQSFSPSPKKIHRLDFGPVLTGIALSSVRMHRYSPITAINAMQAMLTSHQDKAAGRWALYIQQPIMWKKCTVTVKSRHCFPRRMKNHRPRALQEQWHRKDAKVWVLNVDHFLRKHLKFSTFTLNEMCNCTDVNKV